MFGLVNDIGGVVLSNVLQIAVGSVLAVIIYKFSVGKCHIFKVRTSYSILVIVASSLLGLLLPLDTYGVIPVALMFLAVGVRYENVLPLMFSNAMFNMMVSFVDQSFSWKTGIGRIILAFIAGIVSGVVFKIFKSKNENIIKIKTSSLNGGSPNILLEIVRFFCENINALGLYLVAGAIINVVFHKYLLESVINIVFMNPSFSNSLSFLLIFDIANPFIQYTFNLFVNFTTLSAFAGFLRLKAIFALVVTYSVLALLFSVLAFI